MRMCFILDDDGSLCEPMCYTPHVMPHHLIAFIPLMERKPILLPHRKNSKERVLLIRSYMRASTIHPQLLPSFGWTRTVKILNHDGLRFWYNQGYFAILEGKHMLTQCTLYVTLFSQIYIHSEDFINTFQLFMISHNNLVKVFRCPSTRICVHTHAGSWVSNIHQVSVNPRLNVNMNFTYSYY